MFLQSPILLANHTQGTASLWSAAAGLSKIHGLWKLYILGKTYFNPDNFLKLGAGLIYKSLAGDCLILKIPAVPFFITSKFLYLFEQEDAWIKEYDQWLETLKGVQPVHAKITEDISRYKISWLQYSAQHLLIRIQRIALSSLQLAWQSFKLVMRIMDVVEMITIDPAKINDLINQSISESGIHIPRCLNALLKNKMYFIKRLENKESGIDHALKLIGCQSIKAADIINQTKGFFDFCENGLDGYEKINRKVGDAIKELGKKVIYDLSPKTIQQILKEQDLAPKSNQEILQLNKKPASIQRPPRPFLCYATRPPVDTSSSLDKNTHSRHRPMKKLNTFGLSSKPIQPPKILKAC